MKYTNFAGTETQVSKICFGAMGLNCAFGQFDEKELISSIHHSLDQGINMIDTAPTYGDSERILGTALKKWKGATPFICSKAAPQASPTNNGWGLPNPVDISYPKGSVTESVETSLKQLDIDYIDLMQLHQYWSQFEGSHWFDEMQALKEQGKIKHIGISITDHRHDQALSIVKSGAIDSVQTIVNILGVGSDLRSAKKSWDPNSGHECTLGVSTYAQTRKEVPDGKYAGSERVCDEIAEKYPPVGESVAVGARRTGCISSGGGRTSSRFG